VPAATLAWTDPFVSLPETRLLVVRGPAGLVPSYRLHKREFVVGGASGPEVDLVVPIPQVSGRHATFQVYPTGTVFLIDQHSTNGTFVEGRQLAAGERVQLLAGQLVQLSRQLELRLEQPGLAAPGPTPMATGESAVPGALEEGKRAKARTIYSPLSDRDKE
jgi:predicted component of type VI protein secretion system